MKTNTKFLSPVLVACFCMALFTQCGEAKKEASDVKSEVEKGAENVSEEGKKMAEEGKKTMEEGKKEAEETLNEMDSKTGTLEFESGSWGANVLAGIGSGTTVFTLDQIPYGEDEEDEKELSDAAKAQLDALAKILKANPDWSIEVQGHTEKPKTGLGEAAKKTGSFAKAKWVQAKMNLRGITGKQISAKGYGSDQLLTTLAEDDKAQRRIMIALTK